jgi:hypothetical protein
MLFSVEEGLDLMTGGRVGVRTDSFEETREPAQQPAQLSDSAVGCTATHPLPTIGCCSRLKRVST